MLEEDGDYIIQEKKVLNFSEIRSLDCIPMKRQVTFRQVDLKRRMFG